MELRKQFEKETGTKMVLEPSLKNDIKPEDVISTPKEYCLWFESKFGWISVKDRLPKDENVYLVFSSQHGYQTDCFSKHGVYSQKRWQVPFVRYWQLINNVY